MSRIKFLIATQSLGEKTIFQGSLEHSPDGKKHDGAYTARLDGPLVLKEWNLKLQCR
jgi:hypothetical protein